VFGDDSGQRQAAEIRSAGQPGAAVHTWSFLPTSQRNFRS
jgi:hypothetical protein